MKQRRYVPSTTDQRQIYKCEALFDGAAALGLTYCLFTFRCLAMSFYGYPV